MNLTHLSTTSQTARPNLSGRHLAACAVLGALLATAAHADMYYNPMWKTNPPAAGGLSAAPIITSMTQQDTNFVLSWYGPQGTYFIESTPLGGPTNWTRIATNIASDFAWSVTLTNVQGSASLFRVINYNGFMGTGACWGCHGDKYAEYSQTAHGSAYSLIASMPLSLGCVACHTVGFGQTSGFTTPTDTPHLENVGCENCHGPGGAHKYGDHDVVRPAVTIAAEVCGSCHDGYHHPTFDEWTNTLHAMVNPDVASGISDTASGQSRAMTCGPCHSGAVRLAMLDNWEDMMNGTTNYLNLPSGNDAKAYAITCVVCHDPHSNEIDRQLRNPTFSTNFFTFFTGSITTNVVTTNFAGTITTNTYNLNTPFAGQYNPNIQLCGQCHNSRGATWQGTSRPPHHSPQYTLLSGAVQTNYLNGTLSQPATHGLNTNGCTQCHMYAETPETLSETNPAYTGHRFEVSLGGCTVAGCHSDTNQALGFLQFTQQDTTNRISELVGLLNQWGTTKAPDVLRTNYGAMSWEFTTPGTLSAGTAGPTSARQSQIPDTIKQARFNLYIVFHDQSLGVHNGAYARFLLNDAKTKVQTELNKP